MSRTFAYCRVSTIEQSTKNQIISIRGHGYEIQDRRVISEIVSGSLQAMRRKAFNLLVTQKMEHGDVLVVLKLDRLGRDSIDIQQTINLLTEKGIEIHCLDLPVANLASAEGKLMLQMFSAFAEFERNRIRERTTEGLVRARAEGKKLGRPVARGTTKRVLQARGKGLSQSKTADALKLSLATVKRHWNKQ